jgi:hypothetical protein
VAEAAETQPAAVVAKYEFTLKLVAVPDGASGLPPELLYSTAKNTGKVSAILLAYA